MYICDWSSDVCSSDLGDQPERYAEMDRASHGKPYYPDLARGRDVRVRWSQGAGFRDDEPADAGLGDRRDHCFLLPVGQFQEDRLGVGGPVLVAAHLVRGGAGLVGVPYRFQLDVRLGRY